MEFNANNYVKVKLTKLGQHIIDKEYVSLAKRFPGLQPMYVPDDEGYTKFQLWQFMQIFGGYFANGAPLVIEDNMIVFEEK